jgi:hypothetical protein
MLVTTARRHHGGDDVGMIDFPFALARLLLEGFLWIGAVSLSVANVRHVSNARFRLRTWLLCGAVFLPPAIVVWRVITY